MVTQGQDVLPKTVCQKDDKQIQEPVGTETAVPKSWKLTRQQQEFIDMFSNDDLKKQ